jgi:hypothetical protein
MGRGPDDVIAVLPGGRHEFPAGLEDGAEYAAYLVADRRPDGQTASGKAV